MLTDKKIQAISMLVENNYTKTDIAGMLGISRQCLYDWLKDEEFKTELDKCLRRIETYGMNTIKANLDKSINNIVKLANHAESEKIKLDANQYLVDRILGKTTTKMEIDVDEKERVVDITDDEIDEIIEITDFEEK